MVRQRTTTLLLLFLFASLTAARAQHSLSGKISSSSGEGGVNGASIQILDKGKTIAYTFSDEDGLYSVSYKTASSKILLQINHLSYEQKQITIDSKETIYNTTLIEKEKILKEVTVKAPQIHQRGDTISYRLSSFIGKGDYTLKDAMKKLPGIEVKETGQIKYLGKDISNFYIEGLDLLGGKYNIATNNIPAKYVSTVEVLNNHQPTKMDKDVFSDDVALNIKLSKQAKFRPIGTYESIGGVGSKVLYQLSGAGMLFNPNIQVLSTLKMGNIKEFSTNENINHIDKQKKTPYAIEILGELTASTPPIKRERYIYPDDRSVSFNFINKLSKGATLKTNAGYAYSHNDYEYATCMKFRDSELITISQQFAPSYRIHKPSLSLSYKDNEESRYLSNEFSAQATFLKSELPTTGEEIGNILQSERYRDIDLTNDFSVRWRKGLFRWSIASLLQYTNVPNGYVNIEMAQRENLHQTANSKGFLTRETISTSYSTRRYHIHIPFSFQYYTDRVATNLSQGKIYTYNRLRGENIQLSLSPHYEYTHPLRKYIFSADVAVASEYLNYYNTGSTPSASKKWIFRANPSLYFLYTINAKSTLRLQGSYWNKVGDLLDFMTAPVQNQLTVQKHRIGILSENSTFVLSANYDFKRPLEMWFLNMGMSYSRQHSNLMFSQEISPQLIKIFTLLSPHHTDIFNTHFRVTKQIQSIGTKISIYGNFAHNNRSMIQNNNLYQYQWNNIGLTPSISSKPVDFIELNYSYSLDKSFSQVKGIKQSFLSQTHDIRLDVFPSTNLRITASADINTKELANELSKTMAIFDAGIKYRIKALSLGLELRNIFNQKYYSYTLFNGINTYSYDYLLRGRELLFSITLTK